MSFYLKRILAFTSFLCLLAVFSACEQEQTAQTPRLEVAEKPSLADVEVTVVDGVLSFRSLDDFSTSLRAISGLSRGEKEAWGNSLNFESLTSRLRALQDQIDANPELPGRDFLREGEDKQFSFDETGGLVSNGPDLLISELLSPEGYVLIEGALNAFSADYHAIVKYQPTHEKMEALVARATSAPEAEEYYFPQQAGKEIVDYDDDQAKEAKFFPCPLFDRGVWIWGHRKEERIGGNRQRLRVELSQAIYHFGGSDNRVFSYVSMSIENRQRSGFSWIRTYPDYEFGTLAFRNGGPATSGETSSSSVVQSLRVDRVIRVQLSNGAIQTLRFERNVTPDPTGWSFNEERTSDADEYYLIDNVISTAGLFSGTSIIRSGGEYGFSRGKISVNWLNRSSTMDIQLGCE